MSQEYMASILLSVPPNEILALLKNIIVASVQDQHAAKEVAAETLLSLVKEHNTTSSIKIDLKDLETKEAFEVFSLIFQLKTIEGLAQCLTITMQASSINEIETVVIPYFEDVEQMMQQICNTISIEEISRESLPPKTNLRKVVFPEDLERTKAALGAVLGDLIQRLKKLL